MANDIGKNIKVCREEQKLTQEALAERLNVTRQAISNWENGKTQPDVQTLDTIAHVLDVSIEKLIYGKGKSKLLIKVERPSAETGVTLGAVLAMVIYYVKWESIGWALLHSLFNWGYVIYYIIKYGWS